MKNKERRKERSIKLNTMMRDKDIVLKSVTEGIPSFSYKMGRRRI